MYTVSQLKENCHSATLSLTVRHSRLGEEEKKEEAQKVDASSTWRVGESWHW